MVSNILSWVHENKVSWFVNLLWDPNLLMSTIPLRQEKRNNFVVDKFRFSYYFEKQPSLEHLHSSNEIPKWNKWVQIRVKIWSCTWRNPMHNNGNIYNAIYSHQLYKCIIYFSTLSSKLHKLVLSLGTQFHFPSNLLHLWHVKRLNLAFNIWIILKWKCINNFLFSLEPNALDYHQICSCVHR